MDMMPVKPERKAELEVYAQRHGKSPADALDDLLAAQLEWEKQDSKEAVEGIKRGLDDVRGGRTRPAEAFFEEVRLKHGFPR